MPAVMVTIVRYVDDSQPGWVECVLVDAHGKTRSFIEKAPVVSAVPLDANSAYPLAGVIACEIIETRGDILTIDTEFPWSIAATDGQTRFEVRADQITELS